VTARKANLIFVGIYGLMLLAFAWGAFAFHRRGNVGAMAAALGAVGYLVIRIGMLAGKLRRS